MGGQNSKGGGVRAPNSSLHLRDKKELAGVGVIFRKSPEGLLVVKEIVGGSSADECGLIQPGDVLTKVEDTKIAKASIADVSSLVLGEPGQMVKLKFSRSIGKTKKKIKVSLKRSVRATLEPTYHVQRDGVNTRVTHIHLDCLQNNEGGEAEAGPAEAAARDVLDAQGNVVGPGLLQRARQARLAGAGETPGVERLDPSHPAFPGNKPAKGTTRSGPIRTANGRATAAAENKPAPPAAARAESSVAASGELVGGAAGGGQAGGQKQPSSGAPKPIEGVGAILEERKSEVMSMGDDDENTSQESLDAEQPVPPPVHAPLPTHTPPVPPAPALGGPTLDNPDSAEDLLNAFFSAPAIPDPPPAPTVGEQREGEEKKEEVAEEEEEEERREEQDVGWQGGDEQPFVATVTQEEEQETEEEQTESGAQQGGGGGVAVVVKAERVEEEEDGAEEEDWEGLAQSRVAIFENKATQARREAGKVPAPAVAVNLEKEWAKTAARVGTTSSSPTAALVPAAEPSTPSTASESAAAKPTAASDSPVKATPSPASSKPALPSVGSAKKIGGGGDLAAMMAARKKAMDDNDDDGYYF